MQFVFAKKMNAVENKNARATAFHAQMVQLFAIQKNEGISHWGGFSSVARKL